MAAEGRKAEREARRGETQAAMAVSPLIVSKVVWQAEEIVIGMKGFSPLFTIVLAAPAVRKSSGRKS